MDERVAKLQLSGISINGLLRERVWSDEAGFSYGDEKRLGLRRCPPYTACPLKRTELQADLQVNSGRLQPQRVLPQVVMQARSRLHLSLLRRWVVVQSHLLRHFPINE